MPKKKQKISGGYGSLVLVISLALLYSLISSFSSAPPANLRFGARGTENCASSLSLMMQLPLVKHCDFLLPT